MWLRRALCRHDGRPPFVDRAIGQHAWDAYFFSGDRLRGVRLLNEKQRSRFDEQ